MKRAFTLIEMMIVIAVLVTLMAMTFRIGNVTADAEARTMTIARMQRLENCLSGFHAAFGCYPPVRLHGNRSFSGQERTINWGNESEAWRWVREICRTQPVGCRFPFPQQMTGAVVALSDLISDAAGSGEYEDVFSDETIRNWAMSGFTSSSDGDVEGKLSSKKDEVLWSEIKLFQYGVMSFLLPRYFVMMGGNSRYYMGEDGTGYAQWTSNNQRPSDPFTGLPVSWATVYGWVEAYRNRNETKDENVVKLLMMPSQAVCARWMPNLDGVCKCNTDINLFGVHIKSSHWRDRGIFDFQGGISRTFVNAVYDTCFRPDDNGSFQSQYLLDEVTVQDGWGNEFYYYSRSPYQSYTLWSSGKDGKTFPPWISRDRLSGQELDLSAKWTKDDIIQLSN